MKILLAMFLLVFSVVSFAQMPSSKVSQAPQINTSNKVITISDKSIAVAYVTRSLDITATELLPTGSYTADLVDASGKHFSSHVTVYMHSPGDAGSVIAVNTSILAAGVWKLLSFKNVTAGTFTITNGYSFTLSVLGA